MIATLELLGALQVERRLGQLAEGEARDGAWEVMAGMALQASASVKRHASGRPGPNVITGDYRRSINSRRSGSGASVRWTIGTNKPQGPRLEYGFYGVDSLGRFYHQPAFPHFGPAADEIEPQLYAAVRAYLDRINL